MSIEKVSIRQKGMVFVSQAKQTQVMQVKSSLSATVRTLSNGCVLSLSVHCPRYCPKKPEKGRSTPLFRGVFSFGDPFFTLRIVFFPGRFRSPAKFLQKSGCFPIFPPYGVVPRFYLYPRIVLGEFTLMTKRFQVGDMEQRLASHNGPCRYHG